MRPLSDSESTTFFKKLQTYIGKNLPHLLDTPDPHVFRYHKDRVYYVSETIAKLAVSIPKEKLASLGTCFGKFTHTKKFRLHITALNYLAPYAENKVWMKKSSEMSFLYGNHVLKSHLGKITEDTPEHVGVVVYSSMDIPLGFGLTARSQAATRELDASGIVVFHQADVGEYLRDEDTLF